MQPNQLAISTGSAIKSDPIGAFKALAFFAVAILFLYIIFKVIRGVSSISDSIGSIGGTSEADKEQILGNSNYSNAQTWLDQITGITVIARSKYKLPSTYQKQKNISDSLLNNTAKEIFDAKTGPFTDDTEVQNAFASLPTKAAISLMAGRFDAVYGKSVGGTLKGFINKNLDVKEINTLNNIINKKPEL
jgi:hypothetical protein